MRSVRHSVNFGLLFCFAALATSGVLLFSGPFYVTLARVHIVFGIATVALVALHLIARSPYFRSRIERDDRGRPRREVIAPLVGSVALLAIAFANWPPAAQLIDQSYESRRRAEIVRPSSLAGFVWDEESALKVSRRPDEQGLVRLSLLIKLTDQGVPPPSIAVWAETPTGSMIETLYLDPTLAYSDRPSWHGEPTDRVAILPIWRHRHTLVSGLEPGDAADALTGATPTHSFQLGNYLRVDRGQQIVLCVEVNAHGDPNDAYPDQRLGQPSLLYTAYIDPTAEQPYALLELTAHGGGSAIQSGALQYDLDRITTARRLVDLMLAKAEAADPPPTPTATD